VLADLGCGEGKLALALKKHDIFSEIHSFDLVSTREHIKVADMANLPLEISSVDVALFCLSLMGTNYMDFIQESLRVLKINGILIIVEVTSRFASFKVFMDVLAALGLEKVYFVRLLE